MHRRNTVQIHRQHGHPGTIGLSSRIQIQWQVCASMQRKLIPSVIAAAGQRTYRFEAGFTRNQQESTTTCRETMQTTPGLQLPQSFHIMQKWIHPILRAPSWILGWHHPGPTLHRHLLLRPLKLIMLSLRQMQMSLWINVNPHRILKNYHTHLDPPSYFNLRPASITRGHPFTLLKPLVTNKNQA